MIASQIPIKNIPKWIPRQFLNVNSQVLLNRIAIALKDAQPEVPVFQGTQNVQHQPASGLNPHSTPIDPMNSRAANQLQARHPRNRGPRFGRGRRCGYQGYQGQPGYKNYQYDQQPADRNHRHFRDRGDNQRVNNHNNIWKNTRRGNLSNAPAPSASAMLTTPMPLPAPTNVSCTIGPNLTKGGSLFTRYMNKEVYANALGERQRFRQTEGSSVQCAKGTCTKMLETGPGCKYCSVCGSNQDLLEAAHFKEVLSQLKN